MASPEASANAVQDIGVINSLVPEVQKTVIGPQSTPQAVAPPSAADAQPTSLPPSAASAQPTPLCNGYRRSMSGKKPSGTVISVPFNLPFNLKYQEGKDWVVTPRRGQSALHDTLAYLSSDQSSWNHTVVAWTGEIDPPDRVSDPGAQHLTPLNSLSAPVPVDVGHDNGHKTPTTQPSPPLPDSLWISDADQSRLAAQLAHNSAMHAVPVWLADDVKPSSSSAHDKTDAANKSGICLRDQGRWRRFAEHSIYSLFHYKQNMPNNDCKQRPLWADYYRLNKMFASRVAEIYRPGDIVLVHDYPLMLLPSMLRQLVPSAFIAFFLHCPFPSSELVRCLARRKEVLEGILCANLIGFQSDSYAGHFASCCRRILGFRADAGGVDAFGSRVKVIVLPSGIDTGRVEKLAWQPAVSEKVRALRDMYRGVKIIVGRDRLDSARGIAQKLGAFERFLELYPEWQGRVVLIQITTPKLFEPEKEDPENRVSTQVNELVQRINGAYGTLTFAPVQLYPQYLVQDEYLALLRAADIGLITSVRDGMNMTSLEFVVCQKETYGPLILSEFSGTASSLRDAIHINPWDFTGVADQIYAALEMEEDRRREMHASLYRHITKSDCRAWANQLIEQLMDVVATSRTPRTPSLDLALLLQTYRTAGAAGTDSSGSGLSGHPRRLFMFDYDGTLTPIVREPSTAVPSERILLGLQTLAADARNVVWVISGRDQAFLQEHLGHIAHLGLSAEHGSFIREPGRKTWDNLAEKFDMSWKPKVMAVFQRYTDSLPGSVVEEKLSGCTWHYRQAEEGRAVEVAAQVMQELLDTVGQEYDEVMVMKGKCTVEAKLKCIHKGEISKRLVERHNGADKSGLNFVFCTGDDTTDEDMFEVLNRFIPSKLAADHVFSITVGPSDKITQARWHVLEAEDMIQCVLLLASEDSLMGEQTPDPYGLSEVNFAALAAVDGHLPNRRGGLKG